VSPLSAADPLAPFAIDPGSTTVDIQPAPAVDSSGKLLLTWTRRQAGQSDAVVAARLGAGGALLTGPTVWGTGLALDTASLGTGFMALRGELPSGGEWAQHLSADGAAVGSRQPLGILQFLEVRGDPRGGAVAFGRGPDGVVGVRYGADGTVPGEPFILERGVQRFDAGIDAKGNIVLAFTDPGNRLLGRRYTASRKPIGGSFNIALAGVYSSRVAVLPDGRFVVFYLKSLDFRVWARAFRSNGTPVGSPFLVSRDPASTEDGLTVAVDTDGSVLVVWKSIDDHRDAIQGRFVSPSNAPVGRQFSIGGPHPSVGPPEVRVYPHAVRLAPGDFRVVWVRGGQASEDVHLRGQRIVGGRGGDDPCILQAGALRCDLLHDGGKAEVLYPLDLAAGDLPLLGDLDGDGRDEPCLFRAGQFVCDLDRDGVQESTYTYGLAGDLPLLGDLDGDGKDDLCVVRTGTFHCSKLPLASAPEILVTFGGSGAPARLADINGDGKDDPCVFAGGQFSCDTAHNGGAAEVQGAFTLGPNETTPFFGDLDNDLRADPCAYSPGRFRCLLSTTGKVQFVAFGGAQAVPLVGNLDGR
jgi:hypothetical protein